MITKNERDDVRIVNSVVREAEINKVSISVVIPTLNAERHIGSLLSLLEKQTIQPCEILIIDSSSGDNTLSIAKTYRKVQTITIKTSEFNHGGTRDLGMKYSKGNLVLFLTQDAVPAGNTLIENLIAPLFENPQIAAVYARQIPRKNSSPREKLVRAYNYPEQSAIHSEGDIPQKVCGLSPLNNIYRDHSFRDRGAHRLALDACIAGLRYLYEPFPSLVDCSPCLHDVVLEYASERSVVEHTGDSAVDLE